MGLELSKAEIASALENPAHQPRTEASHLERFDAAKLAQVLEYQLEQCRRKGLSNVTLTMNLEDTAALATALRRGSIMGAA